MFGIDGGSYNVLDGFLQQGVMPKLANILQQGTRGELYIPGNHRGWATLMTGLDPSYHGGFYWQRVPGTYGLNDRFSLDQYDRMSIWRDAESAGLSIGLAGMPTTFPPPKLKPFVIANGGGGIGPSNPSEAVYPPELLVEEPALAHQRLDVRYGDYAGGAPETYFEDLLGIVRQRLDTCMRLFERFDPDLGILAFEGPDRMSHWFFDQVLEASRKERVGDPVTSAIRSYFGALDDALGKVCDRYAAECPIYVVSDHGFVRHDFDVHINSLLIDAGLASPARSLRRRLKEGAMNKAIDALPPGIRVRIRRWVRKNYRGGQAKLTEPALDWERTVAFGHSGSGVYVNRVGRMPRGLVPDRDLDSTVQQILGVLAEYRHPESGEEVFQNLRDAREVYVGPEKERAPDVVFDLAPGLDVTRRLTTGPAILERVVPPRPQGQMPRARTGMHGTRAIFAAVGPDIASGLDLGLRDMRVFRDQLAAALGLPLRGAEASISW